MASPKKLSPLHTPADICRAGFHVVQYVIRQILSDVRDDPAVALSPVQVGADRKNALRVDINAEDTFQRELHKYRNRRYSDIVVHGEERLRDRGLDLTGVPGVFALVDAVDGTDLVERGFSNWCSAAVFFCPSHPAGQRILGSFVGMPDKSIYFARADEPHASVVVNGEPARPLLGPSKVSALEQASLCFYGQKADHFLSAGPLISRLPKSPRFRVYNLAGIPMMMRLSDHDNRRESKGVDAVVELLGQKPHDLVPGMFIALKAGATAVSLDNRAITLTDLEEMLFRPAATESEQRYILASTPKLASEIASLVACTR